MEHIKPQSEHWVEHGHEESDVNIKGIVTFGVALALGGFIICFALYGFYLALNWGYEKNQGPANPMTAAAGVKPEPIDKTETVKDVVDRLKSTFPEPRLLANEYGDYDVFAKQQKDRLHDYRWINQSEGKVRIPIDRAMELIAERGLPAPATAPKAAPVAKK
ncbi:MAG: hypothetical protein HYX26_03570 [Acidobacteriales bacterium]|nr:hypothetical protein [Terriglobales bacterium]